MSVWTKKRSKKSGLPPRTLVHIGETKTEEVKITIIDYDDTHFEETEAKKDNRRSFRPILIGQGGILILQDCFA